MSCFDWLTDYLRGLADCGISARIGAEDSLLPARRLPLDAGHWGTAAEVAAALGIRWAGVWCDPGTDRIAVNACLAHRGDYLLLETHVPLNDPALPSQAGHFPAADRLERHLHDLTGIEFLGQPDIRRWTRHLAWSESDYPLRVDFPAAGRPPLRTGPDTNYPFVPVHGSGVYEIPVGPVHAGIIEPGHFRFQAVGEDVLTLEIRLGYVHKGIEKIAIDRDAVGLARLAARVSGDSTVAHTWAACQAMERATGCELPRRADYLRALLAERERIANHLGDIGAICNDVGFAFAHVQCARLREQWQRRSRQLFGHRLLMDIVVPGGVAGDLGADDVETLRCDLRELRRAVDPVLRVVDDHPSLDDRLIDTGKLTPATAHALGCLGYVGKASGLALDVRMLNPYAPYDDITLEVPVSEQGDVAARVRVRMAEVTASIDLMEQLLDMLPDGPVAVPLPAPAPDAAGLGIVEGWRGEILTYVRFGESGRIARFFPRDPSWFTWPALERLIQGNIVPDFPVCNKSVNGSYSAQDL
jgi:Ni,Fe-hydrogenase III large subunit